MDKELERLQVLGAQKIHENTHIPLKHVQSLLHGSFEGFSRVQFLGFISIVEREYSENLEEIKKNGLIFFDEQESKASKGVFVVPRRQEYNKNFYLLLLIVILFFVLFFSFSQFSDNKIEEGVVDNRHIQMVQEKIESTNETLKDVNLTENNISDSVSKDENLTTPALQETLKEEIVEKPVEETIEKSFKITSKGNVWFGYIDTKTYKRYQGTFKGEKELDATKDWLLLFGHGYINLYVNGELQKFKSRENIHFLYKSNSLKTITKSEFKKLNRGRKW